MLHRREFALLLLFAAAVLLAFLWPAAEPVRRSSLPATAGIESADPNTDITGVVVDFEGRPVAGALVTSDIQPFARGPQYVSDLTRPESDGPVTVTAEDGSFVLAVGHGEIADLCVRPQEYGEAMMFWRRAGDHLRFVVTEGADVAVRVFDGAGEPLPDVRVHLLRLRSFEDFAPARSGVTRADGRHTFRKLSAGPVLVTVSRQDGMAIVPCSIPARGEVAVELKLGSDPAPDEPDIPGDPVEGRVLDARGDPLAGARVATTDEFVWTDAAGRFRLRVSEETPLALWSPGFGRVTLLGSRWQGVRNFSLGPGRTVTGSVVDESGSPIPNVMVWLFSEFAEGCEAGLTDARGAFRFADVAPGDYHVGRMFGTGRSSCRVLVPAERDPSAVTLTLPH